MTDVKKKKKRKHHLDDRPLLSLFFHRVSVLKHFPGWDTSFLNGVMSIKEGLAHIDLNFLSVFLFVFFPTG